MFFRSFVLNLVKEDYLNCGTHNVATAPATSVGNLLERQFIEPLCRLTESEILGLGSNLCLIQPSR